MVVNKLFFIRYWS